MGNSYTNKLNFESLIIQLLFLYIGIVYFSIAISNILLGITIFVFIIGLILKKIQLILSKHNWLLYSLIIIPFVLTLFSVLNSDNTTKGLGFIWLRLPILVIPFILLFTKFKKDEIDKGIKIFVFLTIAATLQTLYNAIRYTGEDIVFAPEFAFFITVIQHPYFGIYSLIALVSLIEFDIINHKMIKPTFIILLIFGISLSTSRISYITLFALAVYYAFINLSKRRAIFLVLVLTFFSVVFIVSNKSMSSKFRRSIQYENSPRLKLWNNAYKVLKYSDNTLMGIGIGDYYENKKDPYFFRESQNGIIGYNPHSQFIEFLITNGIIGLTILLIYVIFGLKRLSKQNSYAIIIFVIIISFSLTESIFSRQYGVQLYSLFIPLIFKDNFKR